MADKPENNFVFIRFDTNKETSDGSRRTYTQETEHQLQFEFLDTTFGNLIWSYETYPERFDDSEDFAFTYQTDRNGMRLVTFDAEMDLSELFEHYKAFESELAANKIAINSHWSIDNGSETETE